MSIEHLIGDYKSFFVDLNRRSKEVGIDMHGMPMSHLLYRVREISEYETLRDQLKFFCREFVETQFNGRAVAVLVLEKPLVLEDGFSVSVIELPAPRAVHMYPSGLESIGVVLGKKLATFIARHHSALTGVKDHGQYCQPAFLTFDNEKTIKFYDHSLTEIVALQGWTIESV